MKNTDVYLGFIFMIISLYIFFQPFNYEYPSFANDPGPALLPQITGVILFILSVLLIITSVINNTKNKQDQNNHKKITKQGLKNFLMTSLFLIIYTFLMYIFGFIISSIIFMIMTISYLDKSLN